MIIREFQPGDAKAFANLSNASSGAFQYAAVTPDFITELSKRPGMRLLVASGGAGRTKLAGFCGVDCSRLPAAEIGPICVAGPFRRRGVGSKLVDAAAALASHAGAKALIIKAKASNTAAQYFFIREGFKEAGTVTCGGEPALLMERRIDNKRQTSDPRLKTDMDWKGLKKRKIGGKPLVIAVAQDAGTKKVLMVAFQDKGAFEKTRETGELWFYSTSKNRLWKKGEVSGNIMKVKNACVDCDGDALLYLVEPKGAACHEGYETCFFRDLNGKITGKKLFDPKTVY